MVVPLQGEGNLVGRFECSVYLAVSEKPVQVPCERIFCPEFLQECLKPKKPLCALCCNALALESQRGDGRTVTQPMESTKTSCHGCCKHFKKPLAELDMCPLKLGGHNNLCMSHT